MRKSCKTCKFNYIDPDGWCSFCNEHLDNYEPDRDTEERMDHEESMSNDQREDMR